METDAGWGAADHGHGRGAAFKVGALLRNPEKDPSRYADPRIIARRAAILAERLDLSLERIFGWCFAQAVLSALWGVEDGWDPAPAWQMAEASALLV